MFKNMKLGTKIAFGFGVLIVIACVLGGLAVFSMKGVEGQSIMLAEEYVPEVDVAVELRGAANRIMYELRGYGFTEEQKYYDNAQKEFQAADKALATARELEKKSLHLKKLKGQLVVATKAVEEYKGLAQQTLETNEKLAANRKVLDESAGKYMKNSGDFLAGQNEKFKIDLNERQKKIKIVTDIGNVGTKVRVTNFKAQATDDMALMQQAVDLLAGLKKYTGELRQITRDAEDIKRIDDTEAAAEKYAKNMAAYIATDEMMNAAGKKMDEGAALYMKNCNDFLAGQNDKMSNEFREQGANLEERLQKITLVNDVIDAGNAARVGNFKAQAHQDPKIMQETIEKFKGVKGITANLRKITRDDADIKRIDNTEAAADNYLAAMEEYLKDYLGLDTYRNDMDVAAGQYVAQCEEFLKGQQEKLTKDMMERNAKINIVNNIIDLGNASRVDAFKAQAMRDPKIMDDALKNFPKMEKEYQDLRAITRLAEDLKRIDEVKAGGDSYKGGMIGFLENWHALQELGVKRGAAGQAVIEACKTTANAGMEATDKIAKEAVSSLSSASMIMIIGLITALVVGVVIAIFITKSITKPINRIIEGLTEGADQVASASGQVSSSSQSLAEGSSEQASSLEETSSSLEEMASMTKQNADSGNQANTLMEQANQVIGKANSSMGELTTSMEDISKASEETSKIIKTIDEIAFQTNLLALNAAVEAARAGEAGAGFAVVADEVRNLALRAADAAKNTAGLIEGTVKKVKDGADLVSSTNEAFTEVATSASKVGELVGEIAAASNEQAQGIENVNTAVAEMDKVTQSNAANAEESASASEEMNAQAEQMQGVVGELQAMVGGSAAEAEERQYAERGEVKTVGKKAATEVHKALAAPVKKAKKKQAAAQQKKTVKKEEVKPDEVIPMDEEEGDFKDF